MNLVDTNVLLDVLGGDPNWCDWSREQLSRAALRGGAGIVDIAFAEIAIGYRTLEEVEQALATLPVTRRAMTDAGLFAAARAFERYKKRGGTRTNVLPDFLIGGEAEASGLPLLTRDAQRYRSYFPRVELIEPVG